MQNDAMRVGHIELVENPIEVASQYYATQNPQTVVAWSRRLQW